MCVPPHAVLVATGDAAFPCSVAGGGSGAVARRRLDAGRLPLGPQQCDGRLEVLQGLEALVDARESAGRRPRRARAAARGSPGRSRAPRSRRRRWSGSAPRPAGRAAPAGPPRRAGPGRPCGRRRRSSARLNGSVTPERLTTVRLAVSTVLKRRPHSGQTRRRRMATPSSVLRESTTRESAERQNGQFIAFASFAVDDDPGSCGRHAVRPGEEPGDYMWMAYSCVTTRCGVTVGLGTQGRKPLRRVARAGTRDMRGHLGGRRDTPKQVADRALLVTSRLVGTRGPRGGHTGRRARSRRHGHEGHRDQQQDAGRGDQEAGA